MSLDVYSGALSKFYSRDFETCQARVAKEMGYNYKLVIPPDALQSLSKVQARQSIDELKNRLLKNDTPIDVQWDEGFANYFSEQLHLECFNALLHVAATTQNNDISLPKKIDALPEFSFQDAGLSKNDYINGPCLTLECQIFFPGDDFSVFSDTNPQGNKFFGTTLGLLERQLSNVSKKVWGQNVHVDEWMKRGPLSVGPTYIQKKGFFPWKSKTVKITEDSGVDDEVMHSAEYAFAVFSKAVEFAKENNVPICKDP